MFGAGRRASLYGVVVISITVPPLIVVVIVIMIVITTIATPLEKAAVSERLSIDGPVIRVAVGSIVP
jgi:TRAP-type mannitol/chloroaromatic compound transport system permease large subunit